MKFERLSTLSTKEWLLLVEAGTLLLLARAALKLLPVARIVRWVQMPMPARTNPGAASLAQLRWAVTAFSRNAPLRLVCFPQSLAMHAMARTRGIPSEILYGVARLPDGLLTAHAWLRIGDEVWLGGEVAPEFTVLDVWKPRSSA